MERRVFLAIFLSFVVLGLYQAFLAPPPPRVPAAAAPVPPGAAATSDAAASSPPVSPASPPALVEPAPTAAASQPLPDANARDVIVETQHVRAVFSTQGAVLTSWKLKKFQSELGSREPLELIPQALPPALDRPFTLGSADASISARLSRAIYEPSTDAPLMLGSMAGTISFVYRDEAGLHARKAFHFQPDGKPYILRVEAAIDVKGTALPVTLKWGPALLNGAAASTSSGQIAARAVLFRNDEVERIAADALVAQPRYDGELRFAGVEDQYFVTAALPPVAEGIRVDYEPVVVPTPNAPDAPARSFVAYSLSTPGAATLPFFLGPKDFDILRAVDPQFVRAIDFGVFAWLVVPMLQALKWLHGYLGNFGWSIILLTVLINLAMFPLRHRSMVSMRKMQALQPEIKAIQDRYAKYKLTDPERQKMNQEMMALYKQKQVNPASGCLPMLLTMPILFAFYAMLQVAIELRHAPFFGWIHDLSAQDPYYVWPLLMGGTMFWQQRITPTTADPVQARIFMMMPIIFTVTFLWFPAGLVIYWLTSNMMAIGQQYLTNRIIGPPQAARAVRASGPPKPGRAAADKASATRAEL